VPLPISPWGIKVREFLADGEWRTFNEIGSYAMSAVPHAHAMRIAERALVKQIKYRKQQGHVKGTPALAKRKDRRFVGARILIRDSVMVLVRAGKAEKQGNMYRLVTNAGHRQKERK
jgi:hypothetical protein